MEANLRRAGFEIMQIFNASNWGAWNLYAIDDTVGPINLENFDTDDDESKCVPDAPRKYAYTCTFCYSYAGSLS